MPEPSLDRERVPILGALDVPTSGRVYSRNDDIAAANERALTRFRRENVGLVTEIFKHPLKPNEALDDGMVGSDRANTEKVSPAESCW